MERNSILKGIYTLAFYLFIQNIHAQLPSFEANVDKRFIENSQVIQLYGEKFDPLFSFYSNSYWSKSHKVYYVVFRSNERWYLRKVTVKELEDGKLKIRKKKLRLNQRDFRDYLELLNNLSFWKLDEHQLEKNKKPNGPDTNSVISISDGTTYSFLVKVQHDCRLIQSYAPDIHQEFVFTEGREKFIKARNAFFALLPKREK